MEKRDGHEKLRNGHGKIFCQVCGNPVQYNIVFALEFKFDAFIAYLLSHANTSLFRNITDNLPILEYLA